MGRHISRKNEGQAFEAAGKSVDLRFSEPDRNRRPVAKPVPKHWALADA